MVLTYRLNSTDPRILPCGTPILFNNIRQLLEDNAFENFGDDRKDADWSILG